MPNLIESYFLNKKSQSKLGEFLLEKNLNKKHWIYFNIIDFFSPLYPATKTENLQSLSFACYGYFRAMLIIDQIIDESHANKGSDLLKFLLLFESCIKELSFLFPDNDSFWKKFDHAKATYFQAIKFEKTKWNELTIISEDDFETLAENKSASMCYPLVDALESLQKQSSEHSKSLKAFLKNLHIAFQYQDDLDDFKKDTSNNQRTYARFLVEQGIKENGLSELLKTPEMQYKYLFTSGIASQLLIHSKKHYNVCLEIAGKLNLKNLTDFVQQELSRCEGQLNEIELLVKKTKIKAQKNNDLLFESPVANHFFLDNSISKSILYLEKNIDEAGLWEDFMTTAGTSKYWVTYYTAYLLVDSGFRSPLLTQLSQKISGSQLRGSYNESVPEDGDTLNFMVGFMESSGTSMEEVSEKWLEYMKPEGGWVTYSDEEKLRLRLGLKDETRVDGWMSPKVCVTAAALKMLSRSDKWSDERRTTEKYLLSKQNEEGDWNSYWWTSPVYATSWAIQGLSKNSNNNDACTRACSWLLKNQSENGSWLNPFTNEESAFYTACAISGLLAHQPERYEEELSKAINWLLGQQTTDGSWPTLRILAIPATDVDDPSDVNHWRKSSFGVNIIVDDHNRVFTTVSAMSALAHYTSFLKGRNSYALRQPTTSKSELQA